MSRREIGGVLELDFGRATLAQLLGEQRRIDLVIARLLGRDLAHRLAALRVCTVVRRL